MNRTRKSFKCSIFGDTSDLKDNMLPTYEEVIKCYEWTRFEIKNSKNTKKEPNFQEVADIVTAKIENIWRKASLPILSNVRVQQMLKAYHIKFKDILKSHPKIPKKRLEHFLASSKRLFDISSCKCSDFTKCTCPKAKKVPLSEQIFLTDQRTARNMIIGNIDVLTTRKNQKRLRRQKKREVSKSNRMAPSTSASMAHADTSSITSSVSNTSSDNDDFQPAKLRKLKAKPTPPAEMNYSTLSQTCDRYGVSDRAAAAIASVVLHENNMPIIDKNKLRRERSKSRTHIIEKQNIRQIPALYFDGRKDKTLIINKKAGKSYKAIIVEEHISLIKEPGSIYLGHITPTAGTAKFIEREIYNFLLTENVFLDQLVAIGCDGTNVNVGKFGGIIRLIEKRFNRPLQWLICLLHMNELPFRHLFSFVDGLTSGPRTFAGEIGKALENCEEKPVVKFRNILGEMPPVDTKDLSTDQLYLYRITSAVISGEYPEDLVYKSPGKMSHARWLTRANRILRLYVASSNPSDKLVTLATYVVKVYAPTWFDIKCHPSCKDGGKHLWALISRSRYLTTDLKSVIDPVLQRNSYFGHPENLLLTMLSDNEKHIRELALRRILKARRDKPQKLRLFQVPEINMDANVYYDLINWQNKITEPPILMQISTEELETLVSRGEDNKIDFLRLPCHTQAVERSVKTVTEASGTLCSKSAREGFIKAKIESRKLMPKFDSKKDFCVK